MASTGTAPGVTDLAISVDQRADVRIGRCLNTVNGSVVAISRGRTAFALLKPGAKTLMRTVRRGASSAHTCFEAKEA